MKKKGACDLQLVGGAKGGVARSLAHLEEEVVCRRARLTMARCVGHKHRVRSHELLGDGEGGELAHRETEAAEALLVLEQLHIREQVGLGEQRQRLLPRPARLVCRVAALVVGEAGTYGADRLWCLLKPIPVKLDSDDSDEDDRPLGTAPKKQKPSPGAPASSAASL